jgi:hypothetical protein
MLEGLIVMSNLNGSAATKKPARESHEQAIRELVEPECCIRDEDDEGGDDDHNDGCGCERVDGDARI